MENKDRVFTREEMLAANRQAKKEWRDTHKENVRAANKRHREKVKKGFSVDEGKSRL